MATFNSKKPSFFERLTGGVRMEDNERTQALQAPLIMKTGEMGRSAAAEENAEEGELAVDVYQTPDAIVVKAMIAEEGMTDVSISRDTVTLRGNDRTNARL